jgi:hypothetical protein
MKLQKKNKLGEKLNPQYNNVLEYVKDGRNNLYRLEDNEVHHVFEREREDAIKSNKVIYFFHPYLSFHDYTEDREVSITRVTVFLEKYGQSEHIIHLKHDNSYQGIGISILCKDKNIVNDLLALDIDCGLIRPL